LVAATLAGGVVGAGLYLLNRSSGSYEGTKMIFQVCQTPGLGKQTINNDKLDSLVKMIWDAGGIGGYNTDEDKILNALNQVPTIPDLCALSKRFSENKPGRTLFGYLDKNFDDDDQWNQYVYLPLLKAKRKSEELGKSSSQGGGGTTGGISGALQSGVNAVKGALNKANLVTSYTTTGSHNLKTEDGSVEVLVPANTKINFYKTGGANFLVGQNTFSFMCSTGKFSASSTVYKDVKGELKTKLLEICKNNGFPTASASSGGSVVKPKPKPKPKSVAKPTDMSQYLS